MEKRKRKHAIVRGIFYALTTIVAMAGCYLGFGVQWIGEDVPFPHWFFALPGFLIGFAVS